MTKKKIGAEYTSDNIPENTMPAPKISAVIVEEQTGYVEELEDFKPRPNEYHLVRLDVGGNEIQGSDFSVGVNTFNNSFAHLCEGDMPTYKVKKKAI